MPPFQEVTHGLFGDGGIILLTDVPGSGEVKHPPDQRIENESGTYWTLVSMVWQIKFRASLLLVEL